MYLQIGLHSESASFGCGSCWEAVWRSCAGGKINTISNQVLHMKPQLNSWETYRYKIYATKPLFGCVQIQTKRVDCFRELTSLMKSAVTATSDSIEASLVVRTAEMSVTFLQQEYEKAKAEQESEVVSCTLFYITLSIVDTHPNYKQCLLIKALYIIHSIMDPSIHWLPYSWKCWRSLKLMPLLQRCWI